MDLESKFSYKRRRRVKLIFNPGSGTVGDSPSQLLDVIEKMQAWYFMPEVHLLKPDCDLHELVQDGIKQGISMFVACGGDGTVSAVARALTGISSVTMGIIPIGTQNNIALSLGIPAKIPDAIALLRKGRRVKVDSGTVLCNQRSMAFFEICSVGLISAIFPSADDIQHGKVNRIGDFLSTLVSVPPSQISLVLDESKTVRRQGHVVLISNTPYFGRHYKVGLDASFKDGLLDVLIFSDISKLNLLGYALKGNDIHVPEDPRIEHFMVRKAIIETIPAMPVMADGISLGEGGVCIEVCRRCLAVMTGLPIMKRKKEGETIERKKR